MLSTWLTLRQAEEALKTGRLDEAQRLLQQPEIQGHKRAGEMLQQLGKALVARAEVHLQHEDNAAAWKELLQAEQTGVQHRHAVGLRQDLLHKSLKDIRTLLEAGEPRRALEVTGQLRERKVQHADLTMLEEAAKSWSLAQELTGKGEFGQAVSVLDRAGKQFFQPLEAYRVQVKQQQHKFDALLAKLHQALEQTQWREVIHVADQVLALAPNHAETRKARSKAWKAVEPPTVALPNGSPARQHEPPAEELPRRMLLWIDGVGGYLVCLAPRVSIGQATPDAYVDIPLFADVSRLHGYLTRDSEGYLLEGVRSMMVNAKPIEKALLRDGDRFTLGGSCQLRFHQPVAVSQTATLELVSGHRLPLSVDGVALMADTCILGPSAGQAHVVIPDLQRPVVLIRRKEGLGIHAIGELTVDGEQHKDRAQVTLQSTITGQDFRLTLEPLGATIGKMRV